MNYNLRESYSDEVATLNSDLSNEIVTIMKKIITEFDVVVDKTGYAALNDVRNFLFDDFLKQLEKNILSYYEESAGFTNLKKFSNKIGVSQHSKLKIDMIQKQTINIIVAQFENLINNNELGSLAMVYDNSQIEELIRNIAVSENELRIYVSAYYNKINSLYKKNMCYMPFMEVYNPNGSLLIDYLEVIKEVLTDFLSRYQELIDELQGLVEINQFVSLNDMIDNKKISSQDNHIDVIVDNNSNQEKRSDDLSNSQLFYIVKTIVETYSDKIRFGLEKFKIIIIKFLVNIPEEKLAKAINILFPTFPEEVVLKIIQLIKLALDIDDKGELEEVITNIENEKINIVDILFKLDLNITIDVMFKIGIRIIFDQSGITTTLINDILGKGILTTLFLKLLSEDSSRLASDSDVFNDVNGNGNGNGVVSKRDFDIDNNQISNKKPSLNYKSSVNGMGISSAKAGTESTSSVNSMRVSSAKAGTESTSSVNGMEVSSAKAGTESTSSVNSMEVSSAKAGAEGTSSVNGMGVSSAKAGAESTSSVNGMGVSSAKAGAESTSSVNSMEVSSAKAGTESTSSVNGMEVSSAKVGTESTSSVNGMGVSSAKAGAESTSSVNGMEVSSAKAGIESTSSVNGMEVSSAKAGTESTSSVNGMGVSSATFGDNDNFNSNRVEFKSFKKTEEPQNFKKNNIEKHQVNEDTSLYIKTSPKKKIIEFLTINPLVGSGESIEELLQNVDKTENQARLKQADYQNMIGVIANTQEQHTNESLKSAYKQIMGEELPLEDENLSTLFMDVFRKTPKPESEYFLNDFADNVKNNMNLRKKGYPIKLENDMYHANTGTELIPALDSQGKVIQITSEMRAPIDAVYAAKKEDGEAFDKLLNKFFLVFLIGVTLTPFIGGFSIPITASIVFSIFLSNSSYDDATLRNITAVNSTLGKARMKNMLDNYDYINDRENSYLERKKDNIF